MRHDSARYPQGGYGVNALCGADATTAAVDGPGWWWLSETIPKPGEPALLTPDGRVVSRRTLASLVQGVRGHLLDHGIVRNDRLGLVMGSGPGMAISIMGAMAAAAAAPLVPTSPLAGYVDDLARLRVSKVLVDDQPPPALLDAAVRLGLPVLTLDPLALPERMPRTGAGPTPGQADLALLLQTSGTTSRPKVVPLSHCNLRASARNIGHTLGLGAHDRGLSAMPLFHIHGLVGSLLTPLAAGGSVIVCDGADPDRLVRFLEDLEPTWLTAVPTLLQGLLAASERHGPRRHRLRLLRSSSSSMPPALLERLEAHFGVPVIEAYGMTEAASQVCSNSLPGRGPDRKPGSVGRPAGPDVAVLGADLTPVPDGDIGEVAIRGVNVTVGYEAADHDGWSTNSLDLRWFRTGDEGYFDAEGRLFLTGRLREMISRGGERVSPRRVDEALLHHPAVEQAVAFALPHPTLGEDLATAVVLRPGQSVGESELRRYAFTRLAPHEVPSRIVVVPDLPRDAGGKPKRAGLAELLAEVLAAPGEPPVGPLEELVAETFADQLDHAVPGRDANFFLLGGDSLSGTRVVSRLAQALSLDLNPSILFDCPTVRCLAALLEEELGNQRRFPDTRSTASIEPAEPVDGDDWPDGCQVFLASYAQSRLWFLHQLNQALTAYHLPAVWRLCGTLDLPALDEALTALIARHPTLRSSFRLRDREVLQVVHPPAPVTVLAEELNGRDPQSVVDTWLNQESATPFDLRSGWLLRARRLAVSPNEHLVLLNHHHIASDGWSRVVLSQDLVELYNAVLAARDSRLLPLSVHYQDYGQWQRRRLTGERRNTLRDYWVAQLQSLEPLQLPTDHPRPIVPTHRGASVALGVEPELVKAFEAICRERGATLQMGLLTVVSLMLHRYSRQDDFAVGIPVWGRNHPDLERIVGCFVNTLPIRIQIDPQESFSQLLAQVRDSSIAAYRHQDFPFEKMVESISPERETSRNPLVQCMFQLVDWPAPTLAGLSGLQSENLVERAECARFDLEFFLRRSDQGGIAGELLYATDLFSAERMERLADHLRTLLESVIEDPGAGVGSRTLLPEAEMHTIISWEHGPEMEVPEPGVQQLFEQQVGRTPDDPALIFGSATLSYSELNCRANQLAHHLIAIGVESGTAVAVCLERSVELVVAVLAILKADAVYLPLDPFWPAVRRAAIRRDANAAIQIDRELCRRAFGDSAAAPATASPSGGPDPQSLAYLLSTSGSTGTPKTVAVPHGTLSNLIAWHRNDIRLGRPATTLQFAAATFDVSIQEIFTTLTVGGCLALIDEETRRDPRLLWKFLVQQNVERVFLPYVALEQLALAATAPESACLLDIVSAGEKLALTEPIRDLLHSLPNCRLHNHYGPTESHVVSAHVVEDSSTLQPEGVSIGRPIANAVIRILDGAGLRCPIGVSGELHIGGLARARGYLNSPELTAAKFIEDPFSRAAEAGLYRSGDLASWNTDGTLCFHGRLDEQFKLSGYRIEPTEVEANLVAHPAVAQVAVVLRGEVPSVSSLIAYWVPRSAGGSVSADELRTFLGERLPGYMVPSAFIEIVDMPLNANGKLDRRSLPSVAPSGERPQRSAPRSSVEYQLQALWAEVLGHNDFGSTDNFFLVGGHSLSAVRLATAVETRWGREVSVAEIFARPTIEEQAGWLNRGEPGSAGEVPGNLVTLQPDGHLPPLYVIHGKGGSVANFIGIARALAPRRPVLGLQAVGPDDVAPPTVSSIASRYADQILARHPRSTPVHLAGFSAGGWYAHAVAAALQERGAAIGVLAILDTGLAAKTHRRVLLGYYAQRLAHHCRDFIRSSNGKSLKRYVADGFSAMKHHLAIQRGYPTDAADLYLALLREFRPQPLAVAIDLFAPRKHIPLKSYIWRFYARGEARMHPIFETHSDFARQELMAEIAVEIEDALARSEAATVPRGMPTRRH